MGHFHTLASSGFHTVHYESWGPENGRPLLCVHGLTGSHADFKYVGEYMARHGYRTVAIDIPGRGMSDFLPNPADYNFGQYLHAINVWMAQLGYTAPNSVDWLGVSMGGLLGMIIAGMPHSPIKRMILSDVGPEVPKIAIDFLVEYLSRAPVFETAEDVVAAFRQSANSPFDRGPMSDEQFRHFALTHVRKREDGKYIRSFDPGIMEVFAREPLGNLNIWPLWDKITQPVLTLRGEWSTLLTVAIVEDMHKRKTGAPMDLVTVEKCGHVPSLYPDDQIRILSDWLAQAA